MLRTPPAPFGTQATRLHGGRIVLVVGTLLGLAGGWLGSAARSLVAPSARVDANGNG